jgi:hypothetical protein
MDAAGEMVSVDAEALELATDVMMRAAAPFDAKVTQYSCDAGRVRRGISQDLPCVFHAQSVGRGYDNF